jgi:hypothetical protein
MWGGGVLVDRCGGQQAANTMLLNVGDCRGIVHFDGGETLLRRTPCLLTAADHEVVAAQPWSELPFNKHYAAKGRTQ